jgi:hypothetical protein|tara:strand:+ start:192 stop:464 length:273 start_codon:yes stop_codon:yes gene_type:complete
MIEEYIQDMWFGEVYETPRPVNDNPDPIGIDWFSEVTRTPVNDVFTLSWDEAIFGNLREKEPEVLYMANQIDLGAYTLFAPGESLITYSV